MNIHGVNHSNLNPYSKQNNQPQHQEGVQKQDQLDISSKAREMQEQSKLEKQRQDKVQALKARIESDDYQMDAQQTAEKFYEFWKGES